MSFSNNDGDYRVVRRDGCVLIFGSVPLDDFLGLSKLAPKNALMSIKLATFLGATFVFGLQDDLDRLLESSKPELLERAMAKYKLDTYDLSDAEIQWLAWGDRGISSETIFQKVRGVILRDPKSFSTPLDPADLRRCRLLLECSPFISERFKAVMREEAAWRPLVDHWDELCALMDEESPEWRTPTPDTKSPRTYERMQTLLK